MKKLILAMLLTVGVCACSHNNRVCNKKTAPKPQTTVAQPVVQPAVAQQPTAQPCCQGATYTVTEPVEVIYKNVTYKTVYEPKTYSTTTFVKKPYNCAEAGTCNAAPAPVAPVAQ